MLRPDPLYFSFLEKIDTNQEGNSNVDKAITNRLCQIVPPYEDIHRHLIPDIEIFKVGNDMIEECAGCL